MQSHVAINNDDLVVLIQILQGNAVVNYRGCSQLSCQNTYSWKMHPIMCKHFYKKCFSRYDTLRRVATLQTRTTSSWVITLTGEKNRSKRFSSFLLTKSNIQKTFFFSEETTNAQDLTGKFLLIFNEFGQASANRTSTEIKTIWLLRVAVVKWLAARLGDREVRGSNLAATAASFLLQLNLCEKNHENCEKIDSA